MNKDIPDAGCVRDIFVYSTLMLTDRPQQASHTFIQE